MSDKDFVLTYEFPVNADKLYAQFATAEGVRHWWTDNCEMEERVGGAAKFPFPDVGFHAHAQITRLDDGRCVEWAITDSKHPDSMGWADLHDWVGTKIRFEIEPLGENRSKLHFTHVGLKPLECAETCSSIWALYLNESLRKYLESGDGDPYRDGQNREI